jgi:large subunit ribosomal protein L19
MSQQILEYVSKKHLKNSPEIKAGYTIRVHQKIKEGEKERVQIFEGLVIKTQGSGITKTVTVRKVVSGVGVEKIFPVHSDNIVKIEIKKMGKVRRAKLYYMRERSGKSARLKEQHVDITVDIEALHKDEPAPEEPATENEAQAEQAETPTEEKIEETPAKNEAPAEEAKQESEEKAE